MKLLTHTRRPDISFSCRGIIRLTARLVTSLSLKPGDSINIDVVNGEYLLYAIRNTDNIGRHEAQCYPSKKGYRNYCANSVHLCRAILASTGVSGDKVSYMVGLAFIRDNITYVPIITQRPL